VKQLGQQWVVPLDFQSDLPAGSLFESGQLGQSSILHVIPIVGTH
jgi:hypothetical protein